MNTVEIKEIISDYILVCFDIPQSEGKLRKLILKQIHSIGGMQNTASVYLMPYSETAMALANKISTKGDVVIWRSQQLNPDKAKSLTISYAEHILTRCQLIEQRFVQIKHYIEVGQLWRADLMIGKTSKMVDQIKKINETFSPPWLPGKIAVFNGMLGQVTS